MQGMRETRSFYTLGSSEGWISSALRVNTSVSDLGPSGFLLLTAVCLLLDGTRELK